MSLGRFLLLVFAISYVKAVSRQNWWSHDFDLSGAPCFYPLGGGLAKEHSFPQSHNNNPICAALYDEYFDNYGQYWDDIDKAIAAGKDLLQSDVEYSKMVVFDIDESSLSNLPVYMEYDYNPTEDKVDQIRQTAKLDSIKSVLNFYAGIRGKGYSVVFITGRSEELRAATEENLLHAGYGKKCDSQDDVMKGKRCYHDLMMRNANDLRDEITINSDRRQKLMDEGFEIVAVVGDQWSDLLGQPRPSYMIKLPNPIYYIP